MFLFYFTALTLFQLSLTVLSSSILLILLFILHYFSYQIFTLILNFFIVYL